MSMVANCSSDPLRIRKLRMLAAAGLSSYIYHIMPQRRSHPPTSNHCLKNVADQQKHRSGSRWNPTREQLKELEEIYKRGTRTPPAQQIQLIAAELRRYGRIEGKNVFYWFQNHKARERQRLRRQLEADSPPENSNRQDLVGGGAAAPAGILTHKSGQSISLASSATGADDAAPARIEQKSPSYPWLQLHHPQQQSWTGEKATCQLPIGLQRPVLVNNDNAAASVVAFREKPRALELDLFPLSGDKDAIGSSTDRRARISSQVRFYQFL